MNALATLAPLIQAFGFAVIHSLWQIALVWCVFKLLERWLNARHQTVYLLSLTAMLISGTWALITFAQEWHRLQFRPSFVISDQFSSTMEAIEFVPNTVPSTVPSLWELTQMWFINHTALIGWCWLVGALILWVRLAGGWYLIQRLRKRNVQPIAEAWRNRCDHWAAHLGIQSKVQLFESPHISEPLTLGFWKPVVLFPAGMLLQLSPAQVEALLLHELAHIRRHDFLLNIFQLALETCFFYHPLFWMLSGEARSRRELCCDDMVLQHTSNPILYAKTLTDLRVQFLQPLTPFTMNATGKSRFTERILHIAGITPKRSTRPNLLLLFLLPMALGLSSWWPTMPMAELDEKQVFSTVPALDTTPPNIPISAPPNKKSREEGTAAPSSEQGGSADEIGKPVVNQPVNVKNGTEVPNNVAIEAVKMNVLYIGVDNPLRIAVAGIPSNEIQVELVGEGSISGGNGDYIARVTRPGEVKIRVKRKVDNELEFVAEQRYRVKRIPDPRPLLNGRNHHPLTTPEALQESKGIFMVLENFDFDAHCEVVSFEVTYLPKAESPVSIMNGGQEWNARVKELLARVKSGDAFFFDNIMCKCPGDAAARNVGGLAFKIKSDQE